MLDSSTSRSAAKTVAVRRSIDESYRRYRLIAGQRGDGFSAVAYAGKTPVYTGSGSDLDGALDDLKIQIDRDFERRVRERENGLPSCEEFSLALALASRKITGPMQYVLEALEAGSDVSPQQMQRRSGADRDTLHRDLVRLLRTLADILGVKLPKGSANAVAALDLVMESMHSAGEDEETWTFRPAFVDAARDHLAR